MVLADIGAPMIILQFPAMLVALVPIVLIEARILRQRLQLTRDASLKASALANALSTVLGIPLAWFLMLLLQFVTTGGKSLGLTTPMRKLGTAILEAAWLPPYDEHLHWLIPAAGIVLLLPAYPLSVVIEGWVLVRMHPEMSESELCHACWWANSVSYALLFLGAAALLIFSIARWGAPAT